MFAGVIYPAMGDLLYEFVGARPQISAAQLEAILLKAGILPESLTEMIDVLLWYGVIGLAQGAGEAAYIYSVKYDRKRLRALINRVDSGKLVFAINPAFWAGLDIDLST